MYVSPVHIFLCLRKYSGSNYKKSIYLYLDQDRISSREISKNLERTAGSSSFHQSKLFIPVLIFAPNNKMRIFSYRYIHSYSRVAREYNRVTVLVVVFLVDNEPHILSIKHIFNIISII